MDAGAGAAFEALIQEIKIQSDDSLVPVFKVPMLGKPKGWPWTGQPMINPVGQMRFALCYVWWTIRGRMRTAFPQLRGQL